MSWPPVSEADQKTMVDAYLSGMSLHKAAALIGRTYWVCLSALKRAGLSQRRTGEAAIPPKADQDGMIAAYLSGSTLEESAAAFGYSRQACKHALLRCGHKLRTHSEAAINLRVGTFNEDFFSVIDTQAKAYWLGFITADGCVLEKYNQLAVLLARRDRLHLARLGQAIDSTRRIEDGSYTRKGKTYLTSRLSLRSPRLIADLATLGVVPRKSLVVRPWNGPPELMNHYWRGVFDGDGCIHRRKEGYWILNVVGSFHMADGFAAFVTERTGWKRKEPKQVLKIFCTAYHGLALPQRIASVLYEGAAISLPRKRALADQLLRRKPKHELGRSRGEWGRNVLPAHVTP